MRNNTQLLTCSFLDINLERTGASQTANVVTCILNAVFCLITCLGNSVILHAIWKTQELHSPSFILLFHLAVSDLLVALICQPFYVAYKLAELGNDFSVYCVLRMIQTISGWTTSGVSLLILSVVSLDRLLALTLHLRYTTIVTVPRVHQAAFFLWIFSITGVTSRFFLKNWVIFPTVVLLSTLLLTSLSTLKIFQIARRHRRQITRQEQNVQNITMNVLKCRRSAITVLYIYGLFVIFYVPLCAII